MSGEAGCRVARRGNCGCSVATRADAPPPPPPRTHMHRPAHPLTEGSAVDHAGLGREAGRAGDGGWWWQQCFTHGLLVGEGRSAVGVAASRHSSIHPPPKPHSYRPDRVLHAPRRQAQCPQLAAGAKQPATSRGGSVEWHGKVGALAVALATMHPPARPGCLSCTRRSSCCSMHNIINSIQCTI